MTVYGFNDQKVAHTLKEMAANRRNFSKSVSHEQSLGESIILKIPPGGIPALSGTTPGSGDCEAYYINSGGELTPLASSHSGNSTIKAYNLTEADVEEDKFKLASYVGGVAVLTPGAAVSPEAICQALCECDNQTSVAAECQPCSGCCLWEWDGDQWTIKENTCASTGTSTCDCITPPDFDGTDIGEEAETDCDVPVGAPACPQGTATGVKVELSGFDTCTDTDGNCLSFRDYTGLNQTVLFDVPANQPMPWTAPTQRLSIGGYPCTPTNCEQLDIWIDVDCHIRCAGSDPGGIEYRVKVTNSPSLNGTFLEMINTVDFQYMHSRFACCEDKGLFPGPQNANYTIDVTISSGAEEEQPPEPTPCEKGNVNTLSSTTALGTKFAAAHRKLFAKCGCTAGVVAIMNRRGHDLSDELIDRIANTLAVKNEGVTKKEVADMIKEFIA